MGHFDFQDVKRLRVNADQESIQIGTYVAEGTELPPEGIGGICGIDRMRTGMLMMVKYTVT